LRLPQPGGPGPRIYIPQEQGGLDIPPGTGFPFRRLLRLAKLLQWRYSIPPPHGIPRSIEVEVEVEVEVKIIYDRQSVGQSVLMSDAHLGHATNFSFLAAIVCTTFQVSRLSW
jgi:hypothetical protein